MRPHTSIPNGDAICVEFDKLSKGIDRVLDRWVCENRPTKLTLLNDLAAAIQPGANWGALKAAATTPTLDPDGVSHARLIPHVLQPEIELTARLSTVKIGENDLSVAELVADVQPLFSLKHNGDPIIGLELSVTDGNGYCDTSIYNQLILLRGGKTYVKPVHAYDLSPEAARLIYCAIQNLQSTDLYTIFAQSDCGRLRVLFGPFECILSLPQIYGSRAPANVPSQGLRVLFDEGNVPSAIDIDLSLRLASAALPHLGLNQFPTDQAVQFKLSEPLTQNWVPIEFEFSPLLDEQPMYRQPGTQEWMHDGDFIIDSGISLRSTLGEPLDLALALIGIDDPDVYLKVSLTPVPKKLKKSKGVPSGWRGGFHRDWEVLRLRTGRSAEVLSLDDKLQKRFEAGLNGWAVHEGHKMTDDPSMVTAEALIARDTRRASHHLKQVEAIMDGADPNDEDLMRSLEIRPD